MDASLAGQLALVTESNWREATTHTTHFAISGSPAFTGKPADATGYRRHLPQDH